MTSLTNETARSLLLARSSSGSSATWEARCINGGSNEGMLFGGVVEEDSYESIISERMLRGWWDAACVKDWTCQKKAIRCCMLVVGVPVCAIKSANEGMFSLPPTEGMYQEPHAYRGHNKPQRTMGARSHPGSTRCKASHLDSSWVRL